MRLLEVGVIGLSLMMEGVWQPYIVYIVAKTYNDALHSCNIQQNHVQQNELSYEESKIAEFCTRTAHILNTAKKVT